MATFTVPVVEIEEIRKHPNADALEIAVVLGFECITRIGEYRVGDLTVYIPEGSLVPEGILQEMGLWDHEKDKGKLAGKQGNRVKAVKLRGIVSQGLLYRTDDSALRSMAGVGDDVAKYLGIEKYEPPIPEGMNGVVTTAHGHTLRFDIENAQRYPGVIEDGEEVVITEKLHGTWTCFGFVPNLRHEELFLGGTIITSKGLSEKGLVFKGDGNERNLYVRQFERTMIETGYWNDIMAFAMRNGVSVYVLGETFGPGVQDLHYGLKEKEFRVFDIYIKGDEGGAYLGYNDMLEFLSEHMPDILPVPVLYHGSYSERVAKGMRDGTDTINGAHMREGIVVKPVQERTDPEIGRAIVKMVSPDYLLRKGKVTEYN